MSKTFLLSLLSIAFLIFTGCSMSSNNTTGGKNNNQVGGNQIDSCPNCVYAFPNTVDIQYYGENGSILKDYTNDYTTLKDSNGQRKYFLGYVLDSGNKIKKGYGCGINNNKPFCIDGSSTYKEVKQKLKEIFGSENCEEIDSEIACKGDIAVMAVTDDENTFNGLEIIFLDSIESLKGSCVKMVDIGHNKLTNQYMMVASDNYCMRDF